MCIRDRRRGLGEIIIQAREAVFPSLHQISKGGIGFDPRLQRKARGQIDPAQDIFGGEEIIIWGQIAHVLSLIHI